MNATVIDFTKLCALHEDLRTTPYLLELDGGPIQTTSPIHFQIILDNSSSMSLEKRMINIKRTLIALIPHLRNEDVVSLYTFNDNVRYYGNYMMSSDEDRKRFIDNVNSIVVYGGTNIGSTLKLLERRITGDNNIVLFLTDGMATSGHTEWQYFTSKLDLIYNKCRAHFIFVGYGSGHDAELLGHLASHIDGEYYSICNKMNITDVIGNIVGGAFTMVGRNIGVYDIGCAKIHTVPSIIAETKYYLPATWKPARVDNIPIVFRDATEADIPLLAREYIRENLIHGYTVSIELYCMLGDDMMSRLIKKEMDAIAAGVKEHQDQHRIFFRLQRGIYTPRDDDEVTIIANETQTLLSQQL